MEKFERDVGEWRRLSSSDLNPSIGEEFKRLMAHMQKAHLDT